MPSNASASRQLGDVSPDRTSERNSQYSDRSHRSRSKHRDRDYRKKRDRDEDYYYDHDSYSYRHRRRPRKYYDDSEYFSTDSERDYRSRSRYRSRSVRDYTLSPPRPRHSKSPDRDNSEHDTRHVNMSSPQLPPEGPVLPPKTPQELLMLSMAKKLMGEEEEPERPSTQSKFFKTLIQGYSEEKSEDDPTTDPLPQELAQVLKSWWWTTPEKEDVKKMLKIPRRPANVDALKKTWINTEVFKRISQKGREADNPYRYISNSITKGAQPLATAWSKLIEAEAILKDSKEIDDNGDAFLALPGAQKSLNVSQLRKALDISLQIFGMANAQLVSTRKINMKPHLHKDYQDLCDKKRSFTDKMFGENVKQQIEDISKYNRISTQLNPDKKQSWGKQSQRQRFLYKTRGQGYSKTSRNPRYYKGKQRYQQHQQQGYQQPQQPQQGQTYPQPKAPAKNKS